MAYTPYKPDTAILQAQLYSSGMLPDVTTLSHYSNFNEDTIKAILEEAAKFASEILSPLNHTGDKQGTKLTAGKVVLPQGFREAYQSFCTNGWISAPASEAHGGMGLPRILSSLISEMWHGANMSFGLCPMLTQSAIELIEHFASDTLKATYLPKLISGEWTGTMCMTEPQAGSDVGAVKTRAEKQGNNYLITGTKIYITYGDHDLTENIIHMVLARLPNAPPGSKGLSLFLVPKFLIKQDGSLGEQNDVKCISLEHKLGIHASPTCVMAFGETSGATGYLVGEENKGIQAMFSMMNAARFAVGLQGVGIAEYASQMAHTYANERMQGKPLGYETHPIAHHPDIHRILMQLAAHTHGLRALALHTAYHMDIAEHHVDETICKASDERVALLIPLVKAHCTHVAFDCTSDAMQVFGGMGYIEETGIAQLMRDVRVSMIYEGTNEIQALDLSTRKLPMENGLAIRTLLTEIWSFIQTLREHTHPSLQILSKALENHFTALDNATIWMQQTHSDSLSDVAAGRALQAASTPYLTLLSTWMQSYLLAESAHELTSSKDMHGISSNAKDSLVSSALFFAMNILPNTSGLSHAIIHTRFWMK